MFKVPTFIDTKTIIVNLLKADKKTYLSFDRLQELLSFLYTELKDQCCLENYNIFLMSTLIRSSGLSAITRRFSGWTLRPEPFT